MKERVKNTERHFCKIISVKKNIFFLTAHLAEEQNQAKQGLMVRFAHQLHSAGKSSASFNGVTH